jgi:dethiobiotin synthetase
MDSTPVCPTGVTERPRRLVVVTGTATGIGKTWASARLLESLAASGWCVAARKPVQSGLPDDASDADVLAQASGDASEVVCAPHRRYGLAMAPFMAADALGLPAFTLADLLTEIRWPAGVDVGLVEGAGGVRSPMTSDDRDTADLADALRPDLVVMVADAGLGTINAVRTSLPAVTTHPVSIYLNRYDPQDEIHRRNRSWLSSRLGVEVVVDGDDLAARPRSSLWTSSLTPTSPDSKPATTPSSSSARCSPISSVWHRSVSRTSCRRA